MKRMFLTIAWFVCSLPGCGADNLDKHGFILWYLEQHERKQISVVARTAECEREGAVRKPERSFLKSVQGPLYAFDMRCAFVMRESGGKVVTESEIFFRSVGENRVETAGGYFVLETNGQIAVGQERGSFDEEEAEWEEHSWPESPAPTNATGHPVANESKSDRADAAKECMRKCMKNEDVAEQATKLGVQPIKWCSSECVRHTAF